MNPRIFTNRIEQCHKQYLADTLDLTVSNFGIDLINDQIGIELKCRYVKYPINFAVHYYQIELFRNLSPSKELYWAFLVYDLKKDISKINENILEYDLEKLVYDRRVWLLEWDWINQFSVSEAKTGPYVYVHNDDLKKEKFVSYKSNNGMFNFCKGSGIEKMIRS